ncbi:hypothetical protein F3Y22_tig00007895pilonHSYRG00144 [Hibiscus syriacus]|uniref:BRCT domain-containing protein n=1 Tax=Hibiscus syriacus TaxID=106335 RepID=A0A6A3CA49_HIBSY|nr:hypothetical protein F3Y22_tig00007895pilonHSYRG00144 [Hibiscus syriacus]
MAPKRTKNTTPSPDPQGIFAGMTVFLIENGIQSLRLQIWKQKLVQMGAKIETQLSDKVTHVFAISSDALFHRVDGDQLSRFKGHVLLYQWLEDSLAAGEKVSEDFYSLKVDPAGLDIPGKSQKPKLANINSSDYDEQSHCKRIKLSPEEIKQTNEERIGDIETNSASAASDTDPQSPISVPCSPENLSTQYMDVKGLPGIGKSMQDHIQEIVSTGKLSKLEHLKLMRRIPRHEAQDMESLLQKVADGIVPGMVVVCGGSYRRGKASRGDLDIVITHPDGKSHKGFLQKYVKHLKEMKFLREDLIFSTHSEEDTDSGVDTYFGLCTYPGRELRHRIDLKCRLRLLAESKGYRLDDTGLFPATHGSGGKRGSRATTSLKMETEEVFDFLGFPWLEPRERNL